jgi:hypothetical protein
MDCAVALVQAYLRLNGYFVETEYPIVSHRRAATITLTDLDVLAIRFPGAARWVPDTHGGGRELATDPELAVSGDRMDMIIGEVKEGRSRLNPAALTPDVLETVIRRFGCCAPDPAGSALEVLRGPSADMTLHRGMHCRIRVVVFSGAHGERSRSFQVITLRHAAQFISRHISEHGEVYLAAHLKDDALGLFALLSKLGLPLH